MMFLAGAMASLRLYYCTVKKYHPWVIEGVSPEKYEGKMMKLQVVEEQKKEQIKEQPKLDKPEELNDQTALQQIKGHDFGLFSYAKEHILKLITMAPYIYLQVARLFILIHFIRYHSLFSGLFLPWLYYSIVYTNTSLFFVITQSIILPILAWQCIASKVITEMGFKWNQEWIKRKENLLGGIAGFNFSENSVGHMTFCIISFFIFCWACSMAESMEEYEKWNKKDQETENEEVYYFFIYLFIY